LNLTVLFILVKMKKKLIRYSLDFLIIVLGISLSFWHQNNAEQEKITVKQHDGLLRILEDLKSDASLFELTLNTNSMQMEAANTILAGEISEALYNVTVPYFGTFFNDTAIQSLMSTGIVDTYSNQELITSLLKYYRNDYDFIADQSSADEKIMFDRLSFVSQRIQLDSVSQIKQSLFGEIPMPYFHITQNQLNTLQNDPNYKGHLNTLRYIKISYNNFVKSALENNQLLQEEITSELNSLK